MTEQGQFQSQVFEEIARALAPQIVTLAQTGEFVPPFEVLLRCERASR